jgi:hypothetical protein
MPTALNIFANLFSILVVILILVMIRMCVFEIVNKTTRYSFIAVLMMQLVQQICNFVTYQIKYSFVMEVFILAILLIASFGQIYVIVNVLRIFSVLDDRITPQRLYRFQITVYAIYVVLTTPTILVTIISITGGAYEGFLKTIGYEFPGAIQLFIAVVIEQSTSVHITKLIFRSAKSMKSYKQLIRTIAFLLMQAICDYTTMAIWTYEVISYDGTPYANVPNSFTDGYQILFSLSAMHFLISVFTFMQFKRLFVEGKSGEAGKSKGAKSSQDPLAPPVVMLVDAVRKGNVGKYDQSSTQTEIFPKTVNIRE